MGDEGSEIANGGRGQWDSKCGSRGWDSKWGTRAVG